MAGYSLHSAQNRMVSRVKTYSANATQSERYSLSTGCWDPRSGFVSHGTGADDRGEQKKGERERKRGKGQRHLASSMVRKSLPSIARALDTQAAHPGEGRKSN